MAGNREGALKAAQTNIQNHGKDFYKKIGSKSWTNPERSHRTGFALDPKLAVEAGRKGGKKTKSEYRTPKEKKEFLNEEWTTAEEIHQLVEDSVDEFGEVGKKTTASRRTGLSDL